jgi:hypothetical protein
VKAADRKHRDRLPFRLFKPWRLLPSGRYGGENKAYRVRTVQKGEAEGRRELRLDLSGLSSGTYFLRLSDPAFPRRKFALFLWGYLPVP